MPASQKAAETAKKINYRLERLVPITTPFAIVLGFLLPQVFFIFRPYVMYLFGMVTLSGALKLRAAELGSAIRKPLPILLFFAVTHVLMPVIAMSVSSLFIDNQDVVSGFVLLFAGPTAVSGFILVSIFKGDMALCLTLILLDTLLAPIFVPGSMSILMGAKITMDMTGIVISLLLMVAVPSIIGVTVNEASKGKIPDAFCPFFDPVSKLALMTVIATNASIIAPGVRFDNPLIWRTGLITIILIITGFFLVKLVTVAGRLKSPQDITLIISGGLKNNSAVMTIAVAFFPEAAVLPTLVSIITQQSIAAIMGKMFTAKK
ncbi:MAG: hypothetical protein LBI12_03770 [Treponema sp.]|jgi:tagaturonate reductase|nr:hypothetical protein [Treponema sp.]